MGELTGGSSLLFLGKAGDEWCRRAVDWCEERFDRVDVALGDWGDSLPDLARSWDGDLIVSYLSRWIVPQWLLDKASVAAINFHPATPQYPGIGCVNFALYEGAETYGATCHHMASRVDTGEIIAVERFPVLHDDTVASLLERTYEHQFQLFVRVIENALRKGAFETSAEHWTRPPFTRRQFEELFVVSPEMSADEVKRRIRAVTFRHWRPYTTIDGKRFVYEGPSV